MSLDTTVDKYTHIEVTASFRKFNDLANDVQRSNEHSWADNIRLLFHHCENDSVMRVIMGPILTYPQEDFDKWVDERWGSDNGKDKVPFPTDETQLTAYQYLSLKGFIDAYNIHHAVHDLMNKVYGRRAEARNLGSNLQFINTEIFSKFQRSIKYRLEDIERNVSGKQEIQREALIVFHNHGTYIGGDVNAQGSQVAIGQSVITGSSIQNAQELATEVKGLEKLLGTVDESQREKVKQSIDFLVDSATANDLSKGEAVTAVETIATSSHPMMSFLKDIVGKTAGSLASNLIIQAIKFQFGL